jgi:hypothetical protein
MAIIQRHPLMLCPTGDCFGILVAPAVVIDIFDFRLLAIDFKSLSFSSEMKICHCLREVSLCPAFGILLYYKCRSILKA